MYCRFILFEMIVDLDCTLLKEILSDSLTITKYSQTSISSPLLSGHPQLSGHPLLNGHFSNYRKTVPLFTVNFTSVNRTQVPFRIPNWLILLYFTSMKRACSQLQCNILGYFDMMIRKPSPVSCSISSNTTSRISNKSGFGTNRPSRAHHSARQIPLLLTSLPAYYKKNCHLQRDICKEYTNILYTCYSSIFTIFYVTFWETSVKQSITIKRSVGTLPRVTCGKEVWL